MPRGDGMGPMGMGPMTGWGAGYCAGFPMAGFQRLGIRRRLYGGCGRGYRRPMGRAVFSRWLRHWGR